MTLQDWTRKIETSENFIFVKFGDGEQIAMLGTGEMNGGKNLDGAPYSPELGSALITAYETLAKHPNTYLFNYILDIKKGTFGKLDQVDDFLIGDYDRASFRPTLDSFNTIEGFTILHRFDNLTPDLRNFYLAIRHSKRRKVYVGPAKLAWLKEFLALDEFIEIDPSNAFGQREEVMKKLKLGHGDILMVSAGMAAKVFIADAAQMADATILDIGSAFDSFHGGMSRTGQATKEQLDAFYMKPNFSVVLIARNEERTLPRLLASLKEFQDRGGEICLLDTGSTDKTADIAKAAGCKVLEVGDRFRRTIDAELANKINAKFIVAGELPVVKGGDSFFDYSSARNFAATMASNDMIATPDCDEAYTTLDLDKVCQVIADGGEQLEYQFVYAHKPDGTPGVQFLHCKFYNRAKLQWTKLVHEVLEGSANRVYLPENVIYLEHFQEFKAERGNYLPGLAVDCFEHPDDDRNSHYFARELWWNGRPRSAIEEFERHVAMNKWDMERSESCLFLGDCCGSLKDEETQLGWYHKAFDICGVRRAPLMRLAHFYFQRNDPQRTVAYAEAALTIPQSNFYAENLDDYRHVPHEMAAWAYFALGNKLKAFEHFEKALAFAPYNSKILHDIRYYYALPTVSFVIPTLGREEGLKKCLDSIKALNYPQELIDVVVLDEPEPTVPQKVKEGVEKTKGDYICYAANDTEFTPDSLIIAVFASMKLNKGLVAFHSEELLPDRGNAYAHFVIRRDLIPKIGGEVFCTRFTHVGCDNLLGAKCEKLGEAHHEPNAIIKHNHFSTGKAEYDWIYQRGWSHAEEDRAILKEELDKLASLP